MIFNTFSDLRSAVKSDQPLITDADIINPCDSPTCSIWGEYHAPQAKWYYTQIADRVVAGRKSKVGDGIDWELDAQTRGPFALAILEKPDFLCPGKPEERCYPNEDPHPLLCESDFSIPCLPAGSEAQVEVLDLSQMIVHRLEDLRHLESWTATLRPSGGLKLELGACAFDF